MVDTTIHFQAAEPVGNRPNSYLAYVHPPNGQAEFQGVSAVGRFNSQLSPLSKIPFEFRSPLSRGDPRDQFWQWASAVQYSVCVFVCVCVIHCASYNSLWRQCTLHDVCINGPCAARISITENIIKNKHYERKKYMRGKLEKFSITSTFQWKKGIHISMWYSSRKIANPNTKGTWRERISTFETNRVLQCRYLPVTCPLTLFEIHRVLIGHRGVIFDLDVK